MSWGPLGIHGPSFLSISVPLRFLRITPPPTPHPSVTVFCKSNRDNVGMQCVKSNLTRKQIPTLFHCFHSCRCLCTGHLVDLKMWNYRPYPAHTAQFQGLSPARKQRNHFWGIRRPSSVPIHRLGKLCSVLHLQHA